MLNARAAAGLCVFVCSTAFGQSGPAEALPPPLEAWLPGPPLPDYFEGTRVCANHGVGGEWSVQLTEEGVRVEPMATSRAKREPLPFPLPKEIADWGVTPSSYLPVADGFLVAIDAGEWGGGLWWILGTGARHQAVLDENVAAIVDLGGIPVAITGLAHRSEDKGFIRELTRNPRTQRWGVRRSLSLRSAPQTISARGDAVTIVTNEAVFRYRQGKLRRVVSAHFSSLYPNSVVEGDDGTLYVGMRYLVLRLQTVLGGRPQLTWLRPPDCVDFDEDEAGCSCIARPDGTTAASRSGAR